MYSLIRLTSGHLGEFKGLLRMFGEAFQDVPAYTASMPSDDYLRTLLDKPTFVATAAMHGDEAVGGIAAYVLEKFEQDRREIYIYDLAVAAAHRRKGVATALIEHMRKIARDIDAYVIYVQADRGDAPAVALYESLGRREEVLHFDISPAK